jgi:hypothetical protein
MVGSPVVAAFIAYVAFWGLLVYGLATGDLSMRRAAIVVLIWLSGRFGLPHLPYEVAHGLFPSYVAVLDIGLVYVIFRGDIRLT